MLCKVFCCFAEILLRCGRIDSITIKFYQYRDFQQKNTLDLKLMELITIKYLVNIIKI